MSEASHILSPDTQAALLLCGSFTERSDTEAQPLTTARYNRLADWLGEQDLRPGDLLREEGLGRLRRSSDRPEEADAALLLLARGVAMALALENWTNQGLWILSRNDPDYPPPLTDRLKRHAPPILYGAGNKNLLAGGGLAVIGSRAAGREALDFARHLGRRCAQEGIQVISGGAKGVDQEAMLAALALEGAVVGILSDNLGKASVSGKYRQAIREGRLALISACAPEARFQVGNAMARNKLIYALSDWALVVSAETDQGGTWAGAQENLKHGWAPLLVRAGAAIAPGNRRLIQAGGRPLNEAEALAPGAGLKDLLQRASLQEAQESAEGAAPGPLAGPQKKTPPPEQSLPGGSVEAGAPQNTADDFWEQRVWPAIAALLRARGQLTVGQVAADLGVEKSQSKAWLRRAAGEQKLVKLNRPERYVSADPAQGSLFDKP